MGRGRIDNMLITPVPCDVQGKFSPTGEYTEDEHGKIVKIGEYNMKNDFFGNLEESFIKKVEEVELKNIIGSRLAKFEISKGLTFARKWAKEMREKKIDPMVGVLLYGVPGTAKSTIAEQMAWRFKQETHKANIETHKKELYKTFESDFDAYKQKCEQLYGEELAAEKLELFKQEQDSLLNKKIKNIESDKELDNVIIYKLEGKDYLSARVGGSTTELSEFFEGMKEGVKRHGKKYIVIIDEIDLLTPARSGNTRSLEKERSVSMLNLIDGKSKPGDIFFIATTNLPGDIEPAFIRSGRIIPILVDLPTKDDRYELGEEYLRDIGFFDVITPDDVVNLSKYHVGDDWRRIRRDFFFLTKEREEKGETILYEDAVNIIERARSKSTFAILKHIEKFEADNDSYIGRDINVNTGYRTPSKTKRKGPTLDLILK